MRDRDFEDLPGAEIVREGLADLLAGRRSIAAGAVQSTAPRLRRVGVPAPSRHGGAPAAHDLYEQLREVHGDAAHSRYNAILARLASLAGAAELARGG
ncbi:MAG TPA: hypothetical protein VGH14_17445 [Solirubrobacterales bacterium]|jgi:hypothetical protein